MTKENTQSHQMDEYRNLLVTAAQKSQEDFDKTVITLSSGALGISFVFLKDIVGAQPVIFWGFLLAAWLSWSLSTFVVLISYYLSHLALRHAIEQVDKETISKQTPGGIYSKLTELLNATGASLFFLGLCFFAIFTLTNLPLKGAQNDNRKETSATAAIAPPSAPASSQRIKAGTTTSDK